MPLWPGCSPDCRPISAMPSWGRVVEERGYTELAASLKSSEAVVRQRVSRCLASLRRRIGDGRERLHQRASAARSSTPTRGTGGAPGACTAHCAPLHPRALAWRPPAAIPSRRPIAASVVVVVMSVRFLAQPVPSRPRVVAVLPIGGTPDGRRVRRRLAVGHRLQRHGHPHRPGRHGACSRGSRCAGNPSRSPRAPARVMGPQPGRQPRPPRGRPPRYPPTRHRSRGTNRVLARVPLGGGSGLAVGADARSGRRADSPRPRASTGSIPPPGAPTQRIPLPNVDGVAVRAGALLWVIQHHAPSRRSTPPPCASRTAGRSSLPPTPQERPRRLPPEQTGGIWVLSTVKAAIMADRPTAGSCRGDLNRPIRAPPAHPHPRRPLDRIQRQSRPAQPRLPDRPRHRRGATATLDLDNQQPIALVAPLTTPSA